jgi:predicted outer membrane protein
MHKIIALALLGLTTLSAPAWSQANIRPDPDPRVPTQPGQQLPREDALFLRQAAAASQGQAELGRLATEKAPDDEVRTLAGRIAETHARLTGDLKRLTDGRTLPPADQLQPERTDAFGAAGAVSNPENAREGMAQEAVQSLSGASGEAFGKGYVEAQLRLHDRLVDLYQTEASHSPDRVLATFAITSLVGIQKDRDALRQMAAKLGIDAVAGGQPIQYGNPTKARQ